MTTVAHPVAGLTADTCPDRAKLHTPMPSGYGGWHSVAGRRHSAGQRQIACPTCGYLAIWVGGRNVAEWPRTPPAA